LRIDLSVPGAAFHPADRRQRVSPSHALALTSAGLDLPLHLRNVSLGGFSMEAEQSFAVGEVHRFTLTAADYGLGIGFTAIAVYSEPRSAVRPSVSGWQFVNLSEDLRTLLVGMLIMAIDDGTE